MLMWFKAFWKNRVHCFKELSRFESNTYKYAEVVC